MISGDTIAAVATASGRGGIAVIRVSGPEAFAIAERLTGRVDIGRSRQASISVGPIYSAPVDACRRLSTPIDTGVLLAFKGPHSYTGEDVVEFQCHGGAVTPRRILEACLATGARLARRGEFTERAFLNGRIDYDQAESVLDLIDAKTVRAADAALEGLSGRKVRELRTLYERALDLSSTIEHALDVAEDELPESFFTALRQSFAGLRSSLCAALSKAAEGRLLNRGALVVLAGPPNAGKSSLLNALLEENRAIVSDVPGTTRDSIEAWLDVDGWPIRLVDTAGLRDTSDAIESEGVKRSEELIAQADVILFLGHPSSLVPHPSSLIPLHAKCDLGRGTGLNVSAKTGEGLDELKRAIVSRLEAHVAEADAAETDSSVLRTSVLRDCLQALRDVRDSDLVLLGNAVRQVADRLGGAVGAVYSDDLLENLFSRFCIGK